MLLPMSYGMGASLTSPTFEFGVVLSVLKSGPRTRKRLATGPDHNWFGPDCGCGPGEFSIGLVAVVDG